MKTYNIFTNNKDLFPLGKADFLLATSATKTSKITDINFTPLRATSDAEFIANEKVFSLDASTKAADIVSIPAIITRAVHNLAHFSSIEILDLGLETTPKNSICHNFDIKSDVANIDAKSIFIKGMEAGKKYELKGNFLILGENILSGTTAVATALALGYDCRNVKNETINKALSLINEDMNSFEKLSLVSDNVLIFCAGFLMEASRRFHIVLAGGLQMAVCLLVADKLKEDVFMRIKHDNITLATTSWAVHDKSSNITHLLSLLSYTPHAIYTSFSFEKATIPELKRYADGEIKDSLGIGAALGYANANNIKEDELLEAIEYLIYLL